MDMMENAAAFPTYPQPRLLRLRTTDKALIGYLLLGAKPNVRKILDVTKTHPGIDGDRYLIMSEDEVFPLTPHLHLQRPHLPFSERLWL